MTSSPNSTHNHPVLLDDHRLHWSVPAIHEDLGLEHAIDEGWFFSIELCFDGPDCHKGTCRQVEGAKGRIRVVHPAFFDGDVMTIYPADPEDQVLEGILHEPVIFPRRRKPLDVWESLVRVCVWTESAMVGLAASSAADLVLGLGWKETPTSLQWAQFDEVVRFREENPGCLLVHVVRPDELGPSDSTEEVVLGWLRTSGEYVYRLPRCTSYSSRLTAREQVREERELVAAIRGMALKPSARVLPPTPDFVPLVEELPLFPL